MADQRDARLVLRAEDRATKTFESVSKSVKDLTRTLQDQAAAALRGEGSLDGLTATLKEIEALGRDLDKQRSAVRAFDKAGESAEAAAVRVERATKAYDDYKAKVDKAGTATDAQERRLGTLTAAVEKAAAAQDKQTQRLDGARDRLTALGLSSENTAAQLDDVLSVFQQLTPLYAQAKTAVDGFADAQQKAAAEAAAAARVQQEAAQTAARESKAAETAERQRRANLLADSQDIIAGNVALMASFDDLEREQKELARAEGFRAFAQQSDDAANNLNRFAQTSEATTLGLTRLADAVRQIVAPTLSTVQTLDGAIAQIDASAELATSKQKVRVSQYQDSLNELTQAQAALVRQAQNIDAFNKQSAALDKLDAELGIAANRVNELAASLRALPPNADAVEKELAQANRELEQAGARALEARRRFVELQDGLQRAGVDTTNLSGELDRLTGAARRSAVAADTLTTKVGGGGKGFLGLKPYELTNLGYQINDVFTSLASGISPVQTLAQQGPQIAQLFPNILLGALKLLPVLLPIGAAFGVIALNIAKAREEAQAVQGFEQLFALSGNAAQLSARQFGEAQIALQDLGVKADDARKALRTFIDAGLNAGGLDTFLNTVRQIAIATGEDVPAAAEKYAAAISGGYEQVVALNDITHTLNDTQLEEIQRLFDAGQAQEARTKVAKEYEDRAQAIADKSKSEWKTATEELDRAFSDLNATLRLSDGAAFIARVAVQQLTEDIRALRVVADIAAGAVRNLISLRNSATTGEERNFRTGQGAIAQSGGAVDKQDPAAKGLISRILSGRTQSDQTQGGQRFLRTQQTALKNAKLLTDQERLRVAEIDAANAAAKAGASNAEIAAAKANARKIEQAKLDKEAETRGNKAAAAGKKAENAAKAAAREAETRQNKINTLTRDLENSFSSFAAKAQDDPFAEIQAKADNAVRNIQAKFAELAKLGVNTVNGKTAAQFEQQVRAAAALEVQAARLKKNEDDVNKLLEQRRIVLADIEDRVKVGELTPAQGIEEATRRADTLDAQIADAAKGALDFATSLRTATFDPKLEASIAKFQSVFREADTRQSFLSVGLQGLKEAQGELDALIARRDEVVKLNNALVEAGLKSPAAAQNAITAAFDSSRPSILAAADAVQAIINRLLQLPGLSVQAKAQLEAVSTGLVGVRAGTTALDADMVALKGAIGQAFSSSLITFFNDLGTALAGAIDGSQSLGEVLGNLGKAALNFAATFTKAIAQAIIQLVALKIAKSVLGAGFFHGGGIAGGQPTFRRKVPTAVFAGAVRYHTGGLVGLRPDEVPAILQKGEEVITQSDPRHRSNGGLGGGSGGRNDVKVIATLDPAEVTRQALNTTPGQQAVIAVLSSNPQAARSALGLD